MTATKQSHHGKLLDLQARMRMRMAEAFFNVMPINDSYNCITYYEPNTSTVEIKLVDAETNIEIRTLDSVPAKVLSIYAQNAVALEEWMQDTTKPFPFVFDEEALATFRANTQD